MILLKKFLDAGYIDPKSGQIVSPDTGTPQGGILSPILCNIVLHEFDEFMESNIQKFRQGTKRKFNPRYKSLLAKRGNSDSVTERRSLLTQMRKMKSVDMFDPNFKRMEYLRYADDFVVLVTGS